MTGQGGLIFSYRMQGACDVENGSGTPANSAVGGEGRC